MNEGSVEPPTNPPSSAGTLPGGASPPSPAGPGPRTRRSRLWGIVIAALVVIVVVASLLVAGVIPISTTPKSNTTPSYSEAAASGQSTANGVPGGPWVLIGAAAIDSDAGFAANVGAVSSANCSLAPIGTETIPSTVPIPPYGDFSSGQSPFWSLVYINRAAPKILLVDVVNGTASALAVGSGRCAETLLSYDSISANVLDSPTIASTFWNGGGSAFVSSFGSVHPGVPLNLIMGVFGGGGKLNLSGGSFTLPESWVFAVSPCGGLGATEPTGKQSVYVAPFNATSGSLEGAPYFPLTTSASCTNLSSAASSGLATRIAPVGPALALSPAARDTPSVLAGATSPPRSARNGETMVPRSVRRPEGTPGRSPGRTGVSFLAVGPPRDG